MHNNIIYASSSTTSLRNRTILYKDSSHTSQNCLSTNVLHSDNFAQHMMGQEHNLQQRLGTSSRTFSSSVMPFFSKSNFQCSFRAHGQVTLLKKLVSTCTFLYPQFKKLRIFCLKQSSLNSSNKNLNQPCLIQKLSIKSKEKMMHRFLHLLFFNRYFKNTRSHNLETLQNKYLNMTP